jgi:hypothetical protein
MGIFNSTRLIKFSQSLVLDLGVMDPLHFALHHQWREVFIAGPTKSVVGTSGNDFPGLYYFDPRDRTEHVIMFKGPINWSSSKLDRRIVKGRDGKTHLLVGLFSDKKIDKSIQMFHSERKRVFLNRDIMPDQWEALEFLTRESFKLLPLPKAGPLHDWQYTAEQCLATLNKRGRYRNIDDKQIMLFFETFTGGESQYDPLRPKEEYAGTAELICQAGLASSLLRYAKMKPKNWKSFEELGLKLTKSLISFYDPATRFFQNTYPPKDEEWQRGVIDTWYAFHNLFHVLNVSLLACDEQLKALAHQAINRIISFVRACDYQIPLFAKLSKVNEQESQGDARVIGFALNPSVLGMYAMLLVEGADTFFQDADVYCEEAIKALQTLHRWPVYQMFHQTVQLSWAAWASHRLGKPVWRDDFIRGLVLSCYRQGEHAGLFQGCAGLMYPSFRETVEAVTPWVEFLDGTTGLPLREILNLVLDKARHFLCQDPHAGLPKEGLATVEQPQAGEIGVAIYAAPQVLDLASLQKKLERM